MDNKIFDLGKIGITIKGEWSENIYYERLTIVTYNRKVYISKIDNINTNPEIDNNGWHLLIEPIDGVTPILRAESGKNINIPGTPSVSVRKENDNVIFIFDNLKGDKGDKGDQGLQGLQGLQGIKGDKGDKGDTIIPEFSLLDNGHIQLEYIIQN